MTVYVGYFSGSPSIMSWAISRAALCKEERNLHRNPRSKEQRRTILERGSSRKRREKTKSDDGKGARKQPSIRKWKLKEEEKAKARVLLDGEGRRKQQKQTDKGEQRVKASSHALALLRQRRKDLCISAPSFSSSIWFSTARKKNTVVKTVL